MIAERLDLNVSLPLDRFDLSIEHEFSSRVVGIYGPSGSGKTSLLESIAGLRKQCQGELRFGETIWQDEKNFVATEHRGIGYVPQDHLLFPHLTVAQNLEFASRRSKTTTAVKAQLFEEVQEVLELKKLLNRQVHEISGGEKQRVALGRALCSGPKLLMMDEPLASLDNKLRQRILPFLWKVRDRFNIPILIVSHNPFELQALCDEIIAVDQGRVVATGTPSEVFTRTDLYKAAAEESFQNILKARIHAHSEHSTTVALGAHGEGQPLVALRVDHEVSEPCLVSFPANDILIAAQKIGGISARNQLNAVVDSIDSVGHKKIIKTWLADESRATVVIELTQTAVEELHLRVGSMVNLIAKSSSVTVYG